MTAYAESMYAAIASALGLPTASPNFLEIAVLWQKYEGSSAQYNPWDTTWAVEGATAYNTFTDAEGKELHVWNYPSEPVGAQATADTLENGLYPAILAALRADTPLAEWYGAAAIIAELKTWGTTGFAVDLEGSAPAPIPEPAPEPPPGPAPAPSAKPTPGEDWTVQSDNTLSWIADQAYGNDNDWPIIWRANGSFPDPDLIHVGQRLFVPDLAADPTTTTTTTVTTVTVGKGASLWGYAARFYSNGALFPIIAQANEAKYPGLATNPALIDIGWVLEIPAKP